MASRLAKLREGYVLRLPDKLAEIEAAQAAVKLETSEENIKALRTLAHKLHGTGGSYGLKELSVVAGALERCVVDDMSEGQVAELEPAVAAIREVVAKACAE